ADAPAAQKGRLHDRRPPRGKRGIPGAPRRNFFEYARVALESLKANRLRSVLTMLGVIIGVAAVILLVSLGEGTKNYVEEQFAGLGSNILIVTPGKIETRGGPPVIGDAMNTV